MDPITVLIVPAFAGGVLVALYLVRARRRSRNVEQAFVRDGDGLITDAINMAHIRVAGVGGIGLVAMALLVSVFVPSIGASLALGAAFGTVFAVILILWRRRTGPMTSSGRHPGANTTLSIDTSRSSPDGQANDNADVQRHRVVTTLPKRSPA
jgi:peptidoglycan/LPS O-acetylase OafA/YrhL